MSINALHDQARSGDRAAEERLFQNLTVRFRLFTYQRVWSDDDAKEIVQEALVTIAREYKEIEFQTSFSAWAYKVLNHKISNFIRKKKVRDRTLESSEDPDTEFAVWTPDPVLEPKLLDCLHQLSRTNLRYARVLNLKYQGYPVEDICSRLEIKPNNLYVLLLRARNMLKQCLEKGGAI